MLQHRLRRNSRNYFVKGQLTHNRFHRADRNLAPRHSHFAPDIAQSRISFARRRLHHPDAGDLADFLFRGEDLVSRRNGPCALDQETGKLPVHVPPRPDALHNLLPNIATFVKVERARLFGLLWQITLANIDAVEWNAVSDS